MKLTLAPQSSAPSICTAGLTSYEQRLNRRVIKRLQKDFSAWQRRRNRQYHESTTNSNPTKLTKLARWWKYDVSRTRHSKNEHYCFFLTGQIEQEIEFIETIEKATTDFQRLYPQAPTEYEQRQLMLALAVELGSNRRELRKDGLAFSRWFDRDAIVERANRIVSEAQQRLAFYFQRLGAGAVCLLKDSGRASQHELWDQLHIETTCMSATSRRLDDRVVQAAIDCLRACIGIMDTDDPMLLLESETMSFVQLAASNKRFSTWIQCAALGTLQIVSPERFEQTVLARLRHFEQTDQCSDDDIFVRFHITQLLASVDGDRAIRTDLTQRALSDSSPYVRQGALQSVHHLPFTEAIAAYQRSALKDPSPEVRAAALLSACRPEDRAEFHLPFLQLINRSLENESHPFVLRTAMHLACEWLAKHRRSTDGTNSSNVSSDDAAKFYLQQIVPSLHCIRTTSDYLPLRRYAAESSERIWMALNAKADHLALEIAKRFETVTPGRSKRLPSELLNGLSENTIGRVLSVLSQDDFSYDLQKTWLGYRIARGPMMRFRWWRLLFELGTPSPDKRQGYRHTVGRVSHAYLRAPSAVLAELSETKVPGEPLFQSTEFGWRPYLPLVDDVLSTLNQVGIVRPTRFFTSQGVTEVVPPRNPLKRLKAYAVLTARFAHFARLRNWSEESNAAPTTYLAELQKLGVTVTFRSLDDEDPLHRVTDTSVTRFFPALLAISTPTWIIWCKRQIADYITYFASIYDNSLEQLLAFAIVFACFFALRHVYSNCILSIARSQIALAIGGWGTRGKSGTERLKAALLNGLGHSVLSKSTGCEAMFLYSPTYGELREFPLYRPEDKATIWEHRDMICMAAKLKTSLFIWECMALRSEFVQVLQRQWTRDDLSTITNAIPDHEDVQGPSGLDVAETIATFIPRRSKLLTTEQQMRPILARVARQEKSEVLSAGWLESGMLTPDVLARFPYEEHPDNIALTLLLAKELNCDPNFSLKEMADRLVPDLGVLKVSPQAQVETRTLEFTNGMSANERHGCMGNWARLGFDTQSHVDEPTVWITTVVNNRADRISRSRVFAKILVSDMSADRHVLIGGNLNGLQSYIREAWEEQYGEFLLWSHNDSEKGPTARERLDQIATRLRQFVDEDQLDALAAAVIDAATSTLEANIDVKALAKLWRDTQSLAITLQEIRVSETTIESITNHLEIIATGFHEYWDLVEKISRSTKATRHELEIEVREVFWRWFERKLIVIEDPRSTGERIISEIAQQTPPGYRNRIIGLQNIKGTGLDFVYRWQAWAQCYEACQMVRNKDLATAQAGLRALSSFEEFGLLCKQLTEETIEYAERSSLARREQSRIEIDRIRFNLDRALTEAQRQFSSTRRRRFSRLISLAEDFLSVTDAIKRRKMADLIYQDLADQRISRNRAILELRTLNKRQKDGWFCEYIDRRFPGRPEKHVANPSDSSPPPNFDSPATTVPTRSTKETACSAPSESERKKNRKKELSSVS